MGHDFIVYIKTLTQRYVAYIDSDCSTTSRQFLQGLQPRCREGSGEWAGSAEVKLDAQPLGGEAPDLQGGGEQEVAGPG